MYIQGPGACRTAMCVFFEEIFGFCTLTGKNDRFLVTKNDQKPRFSNSGANVHRNRSGPVWWPHRPCVVAPQAPVWLPHSPSVRFTQTRCAPGFGTGRDGTGGSKSLRPLLATTHTHTHTHTRKIAIPHCGGQAYIVLRVAPQHGGPRARPVAP